MKLKFKTLAAKAIVAGLLAGPFSNTLIAETAAETERPLVQIALLLDTSGSMKGLIEQAKGQLWKIVNEFIRAKQNGMPPDIHVALYEYGKSSLTSESGWIRRIQPLTTDLDKISEDLFALTTNGGEEYCGWVIKEATSGLAWSDSGDAYKAIFIAGNEPFTQGPVPYNESCASAIAKGVIVNTIHCGPESAGIDTQWRDGALLADGKYMVIDHNQAVVHFEAPQDAEIARLSSELNKTYVAFGIDGRRGLERQAAQDANAFSLAKQGASVQRAVTKASANYSNSSWDLVDALQRKTIDLNDLKPEALPAPLKGMSVPEIKAFVESKAEEREKTQSRIRRLNDERNRYVAEEIKKRVGDNTLDAVIIDAIHEQAAKKNFQFE